LDQALKVEEENWRVAELASQTIVGISIFHPKGLAWEEESVNIEMMR
jgi:hypothetical protein